VRAAEQQASTLLYTGQAATCAGIPMQKTPLTFVHGTSIIQARPLPTMATESRLDQVVKGIPPSTAKPPPTPPLPLTSAKEKYAPTDPLSNLPSSPPQIYLNLLILEASLRSQYLHLLSRRRLNTFFVLVLALWNSAFVYLLFLRPREDGTGFGGSVYWVVETLEKVALMGGIVTGLLVWGTGQWERGIRWPRRWVGTTNRGLRGFNLRVVVVKRGWVRELMSHLAFLFPFAPFNEAGHSEWHLIEHDTKHARQGGDEESVASTLIEEDLAPGGDHIKLLLQAKSFSPEFRENWEEYHADYWEKENERRSLLRAKVKHNKRARAKVEGGWKWWTGLWRLSPHVQPKHPEKHHHGHHEKRHSQLLSEKDLAKVSRRRSLMRSDSAHSRQSSRSSTPNAEFDGVSEKPLSERTRRGSGATSTRRKAKERGQASSSARNSLISPLTKADEDLLRGSRPGTPGSDSSLSTFGSGPRIGI
jgi:hypothetical protein